MFSLLQNKQKIKFRLSPFPYFIIDDALPLELYNRLDKSFPEYQKIISMNRGLNEYQENTAYRYNASQSLEDPEITDEWKQFIQYQTSFEFCNELFEIFSYAINKIYKTNKEKLPNKDNIGVRFRDDKLFSTDCQFVINTPTSGETTVIEPHLDNPKEFYAALFYMKSNNDDSTGGNLTTHKFKNAPVFYGNARVKEENVNLVEEIEYKANRLAVFLNTPMSIHGVTRRSKTDHYRKYINIIGEFKNKLFDYKSYLEEA